MKNQKELLRELYVGNKLSITEIAGQFGLDYRTIWNYLEEHGIPKRSNSESQRGHGRNKGENNGRWKGGKRNFYQRKARKIWCKWWREREVPKGYNIHHVDRDWTNNEISNLALLTVGFHHRLHNGERDYDPS